MGARSIAGLEQRRGGGVGVIRVADPAPSPLEAPDRCIPLPAIMFGQPLAFLSSRPACVAAPSEKWQLVIATQPTEGPDVCRGFASKNRRHPIPPPLRKGRWY